MPTFQDIEKEVEPYLGSLVLDTFEVVKLMGCHEDKNDYYYDLLSFERGKYSLSVCGGFIPLKDKIDKGDYIRILGIWNFNMDRRFEEMKAQ